VRAVNLLPRDVATRSFEAKRGVVFGGIGGAALATAVLASMMISAGGAASSKQEELDGITPSEAIHYKELATGVSRLLDSVAPRGCEDVQPDRSNRPIPIVIEGGLSQTWGERQTEAHHIGSERGETVAV